jgi:hypothetical protein
VVYSFCVPPNNLGVPVSSRGTLEYNRVDLTLYSKIFFSIIDIRQRVEICLGIFMQKWKAIHHTLVEHEGVRPLSQ